MENDYTFFPYFDPNKIKNIFVTPGKYLLWGIDLMILDKRCTYNNERQSNKDVILIQGPTPYYPFKQAFIPFAKFSGIKCVWCLGISDYFWMVEQQLSSDIMVRIFVDGILDFCI